MVRAHVEHQRSTLLRLSLLLFRLLLFLLSCLRLRRGGRSRVLRRTFGRRRSLPGCWLSRRRAVIACRWRRSRTCCLRTIIRWWRRWPIRLRRIFIWFRTICRWRRCRPIGFCCRWPNRFGMIRIRLRMIGGWSRCGPIGFSCGWPTWFRTIRIRFRTIIRLYRVRPVHLSRTLIGRGSIPRTIARLIGDRLAGSSGVPRLIAGMPHGRGSRLSCRRHLYHRMRRRCWTQRLHLAPS